MYFEKTKKYDVFLIVTILLTLLFSTVYLGILDKFWFEDDPWQYALVRAINNPFEVFYNPNIMRTFGTGASAVPMQLLSYWFDIKIFGVSPLAAYLHSVISLVLTTALLYSVFVVLTKDRAVSACISLLWLFIPSTIAVHYFISTRHYVEGFGWSLLACWLVLKLCSQSGKDQGYLRVIIMCMCVMAAMLSKEIYITTLPSFIFFYSISKRRYMLAITQVFIVMAYICYRFWLIGGVGNYPVSMLGVAGYLKYLEMLPFSLALGNGGYILLGGMVIGSICLMITRFKDVYKPLLMMTVLIATALLASYPTASPVLGSIFTPGTWYRGTFIINTLLLLSMGYLLAKFASRFMQVACLVVMLIILIPGAHKTRAYWNYRLQNAGDEAKFYLSNPDKLLLSQERAAWYIPGIEKLYGVSAPHYIDMKSLKGDQVKKLINKYPTIWVIEDGSAYQNQQLYWQIRTQNN